MRNARWTASNDIRGLDRNFELPSQPQSDIAFGFRIWYGRQNIQQGREIGPAKKNFSFDVLQRLSRSMTLHAMPLITSNDTVGNTSDRLLGFPFAIVEIKRNVSPAREKCICQAANGTSTSLKIQEKLWNESGARGRPPPVVSFTCIGAEVKMWLTFIITSKDKRTGHVCPLTLVTTLSIADMHSS